MTYDIVFRNARLIDGTGADARIADVAVKDGLIAEVGKIGGTADREISADGLLLTPGFVDVHSHYDGQVSWDDKIDPSSQLGVTTTVMGNCGVGFAPCRPADRDALISLMEGVEDIPGLCLHEGLTWNWESFDDYMDAIAEIPRTIDVAAQIPHGPLRVYVMGQRGIDREPATEADIAEMQRLIRSGMAAGAWGFSSSRTILHRTAAGEPVPTFGAAEHEIMALGHALAESGKGVIEMVSDTIGAALADPDDAELELYGRIARETGRPVSFSLLESDLHTAGAWRRAMNRAEKFAQDGARLHFQVSARATGVLQGLQASTHPFMFHPSYRAIAALPFAEKLAIMRTPEFRSAILTEDMAEDFSADPSAAPLIKRLMPIENLAGQAFLLGSSPNYEPAPEASLLNRARRAGVDVKAYVYDQLLEDEGRALIYIPLLNYTEGNLDTTGEMLRHPLALPGLGDSGAHVGSICDASFPLFLLSYWGRDRAHGRMRLETLVEMQTGRTAAYMGMHDRGIIAPGRRADLNLIDFDNVRLDAPEVRHDLPAGGGRLMQRAHGIKATFVNGEMIAENGVLTGARPGRLVRS